MKVGGKMGNGADPDGTDLVILVQGEFEPPPQLLLFGAKRKKIYWMLGFGFSKVLDIHDIQMV